MLESSLPTSRSAPASGPSVCSSQRPWDMVPPTNEPALALGPPGPQPNPKVGGHHAWDPLGPGPVNQQADTKTWNAPGLQLCPPTGQNQLGDLGPFSKQQWDPTSLIKKSTNNKCWKGCREKGILVHCWGECKLVQPLWKTVWRFLRKLKIELPYDPAISCLGIYLKKTKTLIWKNTCNPYVHCSIIYSSQEMEATYGSIKR